MEQLLDLVHFQFFTNALQAAFLCSIICGIIGTYIVTKRLVFISGGITHASFGGIGLGYFLGLNPILSAMVFGVFSALGVEYMSQKGRIRQDSAIAILWSFGMALGILFVFLTPGYAPNLMTWLFGNILTVTSFDLTLLLTLAILVSTLMLLFYRPVLYVAFDEDFAKVRNLPVQLIKMTLMALTAIAIVLSIRVVGLILVLSLLTIPQTIANLFSANFGKIMVSSILIGLVGCMGGLLGAYFLDVPSGAAIIITLVILYFLAWLVKKIIQ